MQSRNPVFARAEGFNGKGNVNAYGNVTYPGSGQSYAGYGSPSTWGVGTPGSPSTPTSTGAYQGPMTIDSVVQKTGLTLAVVFVAAALTWLVTGDVANQGSLSTLYGLSMVGALGGFVLAMVNSFKRVVSPALVLAYAALEGVFIGGFSKVVANYFGGTSGGTSIVVGAVLGTVAAVAGTLAAYKFLDIKVGQRFRKWVVGLMFGFVAVAFLDFVLSFFGSSFGFNGFGGVGLVSSVIGLGLGVLMLILDFDYVERGIRAGLPERESWRAAFGLTVTIVWIYVELLRILAILNRR
ncbi:MAG TPA: Bax inhibitor-1/YccA family protein [Marmoricola sp.]|nr:Bax inhibitor-1/YccA family protein [Marmoricola sp.]